MARRYANERLGKLIQDHIGHNHGNSLEAALKLSKKFTLSDTTCFQVINGLLRGNVLGNFHHIPDKGRISFKDHALRLSHYLYALEVQEDHEIISISRKTFGSDFVYPPDKEFPYNKKSNV